VVEETTGLSIHKYTSNNNLWWWTNRNLDN